MKTIREKTAKIILPRVCDTCGGALFYNSAGPYHDRNFTYYHKNGEYQK